VQAALLSVASRVDLAFVVDELARLRRVLDTLLRVRAGLDAITSVISDPGFDVATRVAAILDELVPQIPADASYAPLVIADVSKMTSALSTAGDLFWGARMFNASDVAPTLATWRSAAAAADELVSTIAPLHVRYIQMMSMFTAGSSVDQLDFMTASGRIGAVEALTDAVALTANVDALSPSLMQDLTARTAGDQSTVDTSVLLTRLQDISSLATSVGSALNEKLVHATRVVSVMWPISSAMHAIENLTVAALAPGLGAAGRLSSLLSPLAGLASNRLLDPSTLSSIAAVRSAALVASAVRPMALDTNSLLERAIALRDDGSRANSELSTLRVLGARMGDLGSVVNQLLRFYADPVLQDDVGEADRLLNMVLPTLLVVSADMAPVSSSTDLAGSFEQLSSFTSALSHFVGVIGALSLAQTTGGAAAVVDAAISAAPTMNSGLVTALGALGIDCDSMLGMPPVRGSSTAALGLAAGAFLEIQATHALQSAQQSVGAIAELGSATTSRAISDARSFLQDAGVARSIFEAPRCQPPADLHTCVAVGATREFDRVDAINSEVPGLAVHSRAAIASAAVAAARSARNASAIISYLAHLPAGAVAENWRVAAVQDASASFERSRALLADALGPSCLLISRALSTMTASSAARAIMPAVDSSSASLPKNGALDFFVRALNAISTEASLKQHFVNESATINAVVSEVYALSTVIARSMAVVSRGSSLLALLDASPGVLDTAAVVDVCSAPAVAQSIETTVAANVAALADFEAGETDRAVALTDLSVASEMLVAFLQKLSPIDSALESIRAHAHVVLSWKAVATSAVLRGIVDFGRR